MSNDINTIDNMTIAELRELKQGLKDHLIEIIEDFPCPIEVHICPVEVFDFKGEVLGKKYEIDINFDELGL